MFSDTVIPVAFDVRATISRPMPHELSSDDVPLAECCASRRWLELMQAASPFASTEALLAASEVAFDALEPADWHEAFRAHARIGEPRPGDAQGAREQAGTATADPQVIAALRAENDVYEARFGHVFLIRAAGLDAGRLLAALRARLHNPAETEFRAATEQQREITRLRLLAMVAR